MRFIIGAVLGVLAFIFAIQNTEIVEIQFFFWTVTGSRALMILIVLVVGILVGWTVGGLRRHRRQVESKN
jgi:uncharacterized integral membrane protein